MSQKDRDLYDAFCTACYGQNPQQSMGELLAQFHQDGVTKRQIERMRVKAQGSGIVVPTVSDAPKPTAREVINIRTDSKFKKVGSQAELADVANQFGLLIYGKKFNDGVHGAFGQAQNIQSDIRGKKIVLHIPAVFEDSTKSLTKIRNSINHCRKHDVTVEIKFV